MLRISEEQYDALSHHAENAFEERVFAHLRRSWPERCAELGADAVRDSIRLGMQRSAQHSIRIERDVVRWIDLMYAVSFEFDEEESWAREILADTGCSPSQKIDRLWEATRRLLTQRAGERGSAS